MRKLLLYGLTGVMLLSNTAYATNNDTKQMIESSSVDEIEESEEVKEDSKQTNDIVHISYDVGTGVLKFTPKKEGTIYFSFKINDKYLTYESDKISYINEKGEVYKTEECNSADSIFKEDFSNWWDISKKDIDLELVPDEAMNTYRIFDKVENEGKEFSIRGYNNGDKITVQVVNKTADGVYSDVQTQDFYYGGIVVETVENINPKVESIEKGQNYETIRVSGNKLTWVKFVGEIYEAKEGENFVDFKLTENKEHHFQVYSEELGYDGVYYTVSGLTPVIEGSEAFDPNGDLTPPTITSDPIPETATEGFTFKIYTDEVATIQCDGKEVEGTELELYVDCNTYYNVIAIDKSGNKSEKFFEFKCFKEDNPNGWVDGDNKDVILTDVTNIPEDEVIDRNNYFEGFKDLLGELPLTGLVSYTTILLVGLGVIGTGVAGLVILNKKKLFKKKDNVEEN